MLHVDEIDVEAAVVVDAVDVDEDDDDDALFDNDEVEDGKLVAVG